MSRGFRRTAIAVGLTMMLSAEARAESTRVFDPRCGEDAVAAGTVCLDRYEASVWRVRDSTTTNAGLVGRIRLGVATHAELVASGAVQLGVDGDDYASCADNGRGCAEDIFAVSLPSARPSASITWFQAAEACANSEKRLPTSAEWQIGASGSPDVVQGNGTTDCNVSGGATSLTGARNGCVSARGAFDMVGNLAEWAADWAPLATGCPGWGQFSDDAMCLAGASTTGSAPGALLRGGASFFGAGAGPLAVFGTFDPTHAEVFVGFRCARPLPELGMSIQLGVGAAAFAAGEAIRRRAALGDVDGPAEFALSTADSTPIGDEPGPASVYESG